LQELKNSSTYLRRRRNLQVPFKEEAEEGRPLRRWSASSVTPKRQRREAVQHNPSRSVHESASYLGRSPSSPSLRWR
jgi:hypothetical protein